MTAISEMSYFQRTYGFQETYDKYVQISTHAVRRTVRPCKHDASPANRRSHMTAMCSKVMDAWVI